MFPDWADVEHTSRYKIPLPWKHICSVVLRNAHLQTGAHGVNVVGSVVLMEPKKESARSDFHVTKSVPKMAKNRF